MTAVAPETATVDARVADAVPVASQAADDLVLADMLIEEISIDGMCGVY